MTKWEDGKNRYLKCKAENSQQCTNSFVVCLCWLQTGTGLMCWTIAKQRKESCRWCLREQRRMKGVLWKDLGAEQRMSQQVEWIIILGAEQSMSQLVVYPFRRHKKKKRVFPFLYFILQLERPSEDCENANRIVWWTRGVSTETTTYGREEPNLFLQENSWRSSDQPAGWEVWGL